MLTGFVIVRDTDLAEFDLAAGALDGSVFRMLRQGQRVVFDLDDRGHATRLRLVAAFHDGRYEKELQGDGTLDLVSDPPGAEVWIHDLEEVDLQLVPAGARKLGITPLEGVTLPMGSYLLELRKEGCRDARYPVFVSRNRRWEGSVRLYADEEIGEGFVLVPGGPFLLGGDPG